MRLSAPKMATWVVALVLGLLGILASLVVIPGLSPIAFWLVVLAFIILLIATTVEGM